MIEVSSTPLAGKKGLVLETAAKRAPERQLVSIEDVGAATAFLATDYAKLMTGETVYVDGGYHILG